MIAAGLFLMLKKEVDWIQPQSNVGAMVFQDPNTNYTELLAAARKDDRVGVQTWEDISRIDMRPKKGVAKIISNSGWEMQVDTSNGKILRVAYRRSDLIESIHDGSYFSDAIKLWVFLPTGILLLVMWGTGIYMFVLPKLTKWKKRKR